MISRLIDWAFGLVVSGVAKRIAEEASAAIGEEVLPFEVTERPALAAPERKSRK